MKTIGLLGGIGPQATMDLEARIHRVSQTLIPPAANAGYPPLVVWYHRQPPFVMTNFHTPALPLQVAPDLARGARWLGQAADFLILGSNGVHMIQSQIEEAAGRPVLSMIDAVLKDVQRRDWDRVGVLGFGDRLVPMYAQPLQEMNCVAEVIEPELQARLNEAVPQLMAGTATAESSESVRMAVNSLRARGIDGIILGCTELPFLYGNIDGAADLLNPAEVLAEAAVRFALE